MKKKLKVAVASFSPLVITEGSKLKGFEIDLWEAIAQEIDVDSKYEKYNFKEIIPLLADKKADIGLAGITITEKREKVIDFSYPTLDSGLLISVNKKRNSPSFFRTFKTIVSEGGKLIVPTATGVLIFTFVFGNLLYLVERNAKTFSNHYIPGIFESIWLVICSMSTDSFGDYVPHTWWGRVVTTGIIVGGVAMFGLLLAQVTAFLALKKVKGEINSSRDLAHKPVATIEGSTTASILKKVGAKVVSVLNVEEAYKKLKKEEIDAVVFDAPAVIYAEQNDKDGIIEIVGEIFDKQKYAVAMQQNSPLREGINQAVLKLKESGQYDELYKKWFGEDSLMED